MNRRPLTAAEILARELAIQVRNGIPLDEAQAWLRQFANSKPSQGGKNYENRIVAC